MTITEALKSGKIRYGAGKEFDENNRPGEFYSIQDWSELAAILKDQESKYVGSLFVKFGEQLPPEIPLDCPEHTSAMALVIFDKDHWKIVEYPGAIITWSTPEREAKWKQSQPSQIVSFAEFNVRRHG